MNWPSVTGKVYATVRITTDSAACSFTVESGEGIPARFSRLKDIP